MSPRTKFIIWRIQDLLGNEGLGGVLLLIVAASVAMHGWANTERITATHEALERIRSVPTDAARLTPVAQQPVASSPTLPKRAEIPGLLADLARLASIAKVDASNARYEYLPGSPSVPAQLEVRLEMQAKYGALRPFVAIVSNSIPAISLREFTAKRSSPDSDDLQAELRFIVVLAEDPK